MEALIFVPREMVYKECSQKIGAYTQETERIHGNLELQKQKLHKIDPALIQKPRFYSDDWLLVQLVKTVYYIVRSYFLRTQIAEHKREVRRIQGELHPRKTIEEKIVLAFKRTFEASEEIVSASQVKEQFDTFARFHDRLDFSKEINAFLDSDQINGTPLKDVTYRCQTSSKVVSSGMNSAVWHDFESQGGVEDASQGSDSDGEPEVWHDCDSGERKAEEVAGRSIPPPTGQRALTVETLISNPVLLRLAQQFLPLSMVRSVERIEEATYRLAFEGPLVGRIESLKSGFALCLEGLIKGRLRRESDILVKLRRDYSAVRTFLDAIGVKSLEDIASVIYWDGLLEAWSSAEGSYCHLSKTVDIRIGAKRIEILGGVFRAGVQITDYHKIKGNLLNRVFQGALYTCLKGLGLVTWNGSTKKPLHSTFSINGFEYMDDREGASIHVSGEFERALTFAYERSWQEPQNFPEDNLKDLAESPWKQLHPEELKFIQKYFVWKTFEA